MEMKDERVLAYSMAKLIKHDDLKEVSGGMHWSAQRSDIVAMSGSGGWNVSLEGQLDFDL